VVWSRPQAVRHVILLCPLTTTSSILALPTTPKSAPTGLGAKVAALVRFRRTKRSASDPSPSNPEGLLLDDSPRPATFHASPASSQVPLPKDMHPPPSQQYHQPQDPHASTSPPSKANLRAWWNHFTFVQRPKKDVYEEPYKGASCVSALVRISRVLYSARQLGSSCLWQDSDRQSAIRKCADLNRKRQRRSLCVGLHSCRRCKVVRISSLVAILRVDRRIAGYISKKTVRTTLHRTLYTDIHPCLSSDGGAWHVPR